MIYLKFFKRFAEALIWPMIDCRGPECGPSPFTLAFWRDYRYVYLDKTPQFRGDPDMEIWNMPNSAYKNLERFKSPGMSDTEAVEIAFKAFEQRNKNV